MSDGRLYLFAGPAVALIVAAIFLLVWMQDRERRYVLYFASAFCAYSLAALVQILGIPSDGGQNAMVSAIIYTFAILTLVEGVLVRFGKNGSGPLLLFLAVAIVALVYYFFYFDRNLVARIYVQNFGYGLMFVLASLQIWPRQPRRRIDHVLFWVFLLFGLHFFLRTILTMSMSGELFELDRMRQEGADSAALIALFKRSPFWQVLNFSLLVSAFLVALALLASIAVDAIEELKREGRIDPLTGLCNRRGFTERAEEMLADPAAFPVTIVYCDIDRFKEINDTFGHAAGDRVIATFGAIIAREVPAEDVAARLGGEEFAVLMARTNRVGAARWTERVRSELEFGRLTVLPPHATVTASFGIAERRAGEDLDSLTARADDLVYVAKQAGRNRVRMDRALDEDADEVEADHLAADHMEARAVEASDVEPGDVEPGEVNAPPRPAAGAGDGTAA